MKELEKLLNSIIKRGWKPAWFQGESRIEIFEDWDITIYMDVDNIIVKAKINLRNIVSIKSWLWQFVCDKELVQHKTSEKIINRYIKETVERESWNITEADVVCTDLDPEYRLLESALIPEEELGKFLVDNIRINESLWTAD